MYYMSKMIKIMEFHIQEIKDWIMQMETINVVDSDDYVEADYVEMMISAISYADDESVMPVCGYVNHDERKWRTDIFYHPMNKKI